MSLLKFLPLLLTLGLLVDSSVTPSEAILEPLRQEDVQVLKSTEKTVREAPVHQSEDFIVPSEYEYFFQNWEFSYPPSVLAGIIEVESSWNEGAVSQVNYNGTVDIGLAQLNSGYINYFEDRFWKEEERFNPNNGHHSLKIAANLLEHLYQEVEGDITLTIMAYNIGLGSVRRGERQESGKNYVHRVYTLVSRRVYY